jgi:ketosteroid isomerase-like protein
MHSAIQTINGHYQCIIQKDIAGICAKYAASPDTYVVLEGPRLTTMGFEKIQKGWTDFCASPLALLSIQWTEGPFVEEHATMAWVAGIIRLKIKINKDKEMVSGDINHDNTNHGGFENTFRASFVLVKAGSDWKIKHEHVSVAHPDPYGIGDWLRPAQ